MTNCALLSCRAQPRHLSLLNALSLVHVLHYSCVTQPSALNPQPLLVWSSPPQQSRTAPPNFSLLIRNRENRMNEMYGKAAWEAGALNHESRNPGKIVFVAGSSISDQLYFVAAGVSPATVAIWRDMLRRVLFLLLCHPERSRRISHY